MPTPQSHIRNFCIIARAGVVSERDLQEQHLDPMEPERERGITITAQALRMPYTLGGTQPDRYTRSCHLLIRGVPESRASAVMMTVLGVNISYAVSRILAAFARLRCCSSTRHGASRHRP